MMRIRSPRDFWSGVIFIAIALGFILLARQYNMGNMHRMGPALFPTIIGALLAILGLVIAGRALAFEGPPVPSIQARPLVLSVAAIALFGIVLQQLGLIVAIAVVVLVGAFASRESRVGATIALSAALVMFSVLVFVKLLGLPIPLWPGN